MKSKIVGGVLLIIGTSIGGGMLALPLAGSSSGFLPSLGLLIACWLLMTFCAFLILEVNLWFPPNSNLISMARGTLGKTGSACAWLAYLGLFYALLAAYISSGADVLSHFFSLPIAIPAVAARGLYALCMVLLLGGIIFHGMKSTDYANRGLMVIKLSAFALLVMGTLQNIQSVHLLHMAPHYLAGSVTVVITSYGFANIIPSLRTYFHGDVKKLRLTILLGSLVPLFCYILWDLAVMGALPNTGPYSLDVIAHSENSTSGLMSALSQGAQHHWLAAFAQLFTIVCVATSFLGVSLSLSDFLSDGLNISKSGTWNHCKIYGATFLPPIISAIFFPGAFIQALSFAGIFCTILLATYPTLMTWRGRYHLNLKGSYQVGGGKLALLIAFIASLYAIAC